MVATEKRHRCGAGVGSIVRPYGVIGLQLKDVPSLKDVRVPARELTHAISMADLVTGVVPDGPADKAGLKKGDAIVALNGNPVNNTDEFVAEIFALKPGTDAKLAYIRNGKNETADVIVADGSKPFSSSARR